MLGTGRTLSEHKYHRFSQDDKEVSWLMHTTETAPRADCANSRAGQRDLLETIACPEKTKSQEVPNHARFLTPQRNNRRTCCCGI